MTQLRFSVLLTACVCTLQLDLEGQFKAAKIVRLPQQLLLRQQQQPLPLPEDITVHGAVPTTPTNHGTKDASNSSSTQLHLHLAPFSMALVVAVPQPAQPARPAAQRSLFKPQHGQHANAHAHAHGGSHQHQQQVCSVFA